MICLGIDTSNYTTSAALYDSESGVMISKRRLLKVKEGELGLRQSEAVFQHTLALPQIIGEVFAETSLRPEAVAASVSPCDLEGSYMPCFMVGKGAGETLSAAMGIPARFFSHQAGHIAAAIYSAGHTDLLNKEFLAFHVSGGTTEAVFVRPDEKKVFVTEKKACSLDLKAGQAVDRVGKMLGLPFPAGAALDALSLKSEREFCIKPAIKDGCCSLSGVENRCAKMIKDGEPPEDAAKYCVDYICRALEEMTDALLEKYGNPPLVFSGGVTSNSLLRERFTKKYGAVFAKDGLASDNAAGLAFLGTL
ncbi:MAG: peptidase M22 [Clostridia bacterium]|nr:peptidase M22 [Clostridia bacterium]